MIELKLAMRGEYRARALKGGEVVRDSGWVPNLITNTGLDGIGTQSCNIGYCSVGLGNTTPAFTDSTLNAYDQTATWSNRVEGNSGSPDYVKMLTFTYLFPIQGSAKNYAEVGVGPDAGGLSLFSRALIVDVGGAPTTFTVLAGEQLEVTYRLWHYPILTDQSSTVTISGTSYTVTVRPSNVDNNSAGASFFNNTNWSGIFLLVSDTGLGPINSAPSGSSPKAPSAIGPYVSGQYYRDLTWNWSTTEANMNINALYNLGINLASGGTLGHTYQVGMSPAIPKDNTKTLSLTFRVSWGRH